MDKRYASRKFVLSAAALLGAIGLRCFDLLDGGQTVQLITAALGAYMLGNVGDTWAERK
ncbi:hypothetical protein M8A51_23600 [Schlegelella sp. S2-27]|uniref:Holin n=1 Tax=Caldimonas mangrovi TaxID=2944811 RepID=A0ABT0YUU7_9BURK|nr:hypothetical protein [Caldimonas mangrovi]MCM5682526.1 hypothetical protein [Caldimonas mangrovi]